MQLSAVYKFVKEDYDEEGINKQTDDFFLEDLKAWEMDFKRQKGVYANYLFANNSVMYLFEKFLELDEDQVLGMEMIDGQIDIDTNLEIEGHSENKTIYAIGSNVEENEEEPLFLVVHDGLPNGDILLKYIPDSDDRGDEGDIAPADAPRVMTTSES